MPSEMNMAATQSLARFPASASTRAWIALVGAGASAVLAITAWSLDSADSAWNDLDSIGMRASEPQHWHGGILTGGPFVFNIDRESRDVSVTYRLYDRDYEIMNTKTSVRRDGPWDEDLDYQIRLQANALAGEPMPAQRARAPSTLATLAASAAHRLGAAEAAAFAGNLTGDAQAKASVEPEHTEAAEVYVEQVLLPVKNMP